MFLPDEKLPCTFVQRDQGTKYVRRSTTCSQARDAPSRRRRSPIASMPTGLRDTVIRQEINGLLAYLLAEGQWTKPTRSSDDRLEGSTAPALRRRPSNLRAFVSGRDVVKCIRP